jgi:hypothetical protein
VSFGYDLQERQPPTTDYDEKLEMDESFGDRNKRTVIAGMEKN